jgi:hypothetical protein
LAWRLTQSGEGLGDASLKASAVIHPDTALVSYDLVIPPSQSSLPGFKTLGRQVASSSRKTGKGLGLLGMIVPLGLVGIGATFKRTDRKRWLQLALLIGLLLIVIGLSGCVDIYGSMRGSYSFPTTDSVRAYLLDPSSALPEWRFPNGSGTVVLDLTVISEDMDGNRIQESCNTTLTIAGEAAVYPDGVLKNSQN